MFIWFFLGISGCCIIFCIRFFLFRWMLVFDRILVIDIDDDINNNNY